MEARAIPHSEFAGLRAELVGVGLETKYWFPSTTSQRSLSASTAPFQIAFGMVPPPEATLFDDVS